MIALVVALTAATVVAIARASHLGVPPARLRELGSGRAGRSGRVGIGRGATAAQLALPVVALVVAVAAVVGPVVASVGVALVGGARLRAGRAVRRRRERAVEVAVPDLVDLFLLAAAAGHPVHSCLHLVADRAPPAVRPALVEARATVARGMPLTVALEQLGGRLGVMGPALTGALVASAATGAPLGPALRDVAAVARDRRRRDAENEARRLPVTMLFPLVCCVLPAFVLLAVVPLLAASLSSLEI